MKLPGLASPLTRMALLMLAVGMLDMLVVLCMSKPLPLAAIIPCLLPLLTVPIVIMPMLRAKKQG
jgi:hypothetical protein